jgi:hypothetical protein
MSASHTFTIPEDAAVVLRECKIDGDSVALPPRQLDRKLYESVNKVLAAYGGKWHKGKRVHLFPEGGVAKLSDALSTGEVVKEKVVRQAFYTPDEVADRLVTAAGIPRFQHAYEDAANPVRILEPSCGNGQLVRAVRRANPYSFIQGYEVDQIECNWLTMPPPQDSYLPSYAKAVAAVKALQPFKVHCCNFLEREPRPEDRFDFILMNPPFQRGQAFEHLTHAFKYLKPKGKLAAILPANFDFHEAMLAGEKIRPGMGCNHWELPSGAFKESGTMVATSMAVFKWA